MLRLPEMEWNEMCYGLNKFPCLSSWWQCFNSSGWLDPWLRSFIVTYFPENTLRVHIALFWFELKLPWFPEIPNMSAWIMGKYPQKEKRFPNALRIFRFKSPWKCHLGFHSVQVWQLFKAFVRQQKVITNTPATWTDGVKEHLTNFSGKTFYRLLR